MSSLKQVHHSALQPDLEPFARHPLPPPPTPPAFYDPLLPAVQSWIEQPTDMDPEPFGRYSPLLPPPTTPSAFHNAPLPVQGESDQLSVPNVNPAASASRSSSILGLPSPGPTQTQLSVPNASPAASASRSSSIPGSPSPGPTQSTLVRKR